jgi:hypothetical protein
MLRTPLFFGSRGSQEPQYGMEIAYFHPIGMRSGTQNRPKRYEISIEGAAGSIG